jgi:hypothetical protein
LEGHVFQQVPAKKARSPASGDKRNAPTASPTTAASPPTVLLTSNTTMHNNNSKAAQAAARIQASPTVPLQNTASSGSHQRTRSTVDIESDSDEDIDGDDLSQDAMCMHLIGNTESDDDDQSKEEDDSAEDIEEGTPLYQLIDSIVWNYEDIDKDSFTHEQDHLYDKPGGLKRGVSFQDPIDCFGKSGGLDIGYMKKLA